MSPDDGKHHGGGDLARLLLTYPPKISYELAGFHLLAHVPPRFSLQSIKGEGNAVLECLYDHGMMIGRGDDLRLKLRLKSIDMARIENLNTQILCPRGIQPRPSETCQSRKTRARAHRLRFGGSVKLSQVSFVSREAISIRASIRSSSINTAATLNIQLSCPYDNN